MPCDIIRIISRSILFFFIWATKCVVEYGYGEYTFSASARTNLLPGHRRSFVWCVCPNTQTHITRSLLPFAMHFPLVAQFLHSLLFTWIARSTQISDLRINNNNTNSFKIWLNFPIFFFFSLPNADGTDFVHVNPLLITHFHICTYFSENFHLHIGSQFWLDRPIKIYIIHTRNFRKEKKRASGERRERERDRKSTLYL